MIDHEIAVASAPGAIAVAVDKQPTAVSHSGTLARRRELAAVTGAGRDSSHGFHGLDIT